MRSGYTWRRPGRRQHYKRAPVRRCDFTRCVMPGDLPKSYKRAEGGDLQWWEEEQYAREDAEVKANALRQEARNRLIPVQQNDAEAAYYDDPYRVDREQSFKTTLVYITGNAVGYGPHYYGDRSVVLDEVDAGIYYDSATESARAKWRSRYPDRQLYAPKVRITRHGSYDSVLRVTWNYGIQEVEGVEMLIMNMLLDQPLDYETIQFTPYTEVIDGEWKNVVSSRALHIFQCKRSQNNNQLVTGAGVISADYYIFYAIRNLSNELIVNCIRVDDTYLHDGWMPKSNTLKTVKHGKFYKLLLPAGQTRLRKTTLGKSSQDTARYLPVVHVITDEATINHVRQMAANIREQRANGGLGIEKFGSSEQYMGNYNMQKYRLPGAPAVTAGLGRSRYGLRLRLAPPDPY